MGGLLTVVLPLYRLREGDPLRVTGAKLPKGKRVKIQAQNLEFLEVSDPKAVYVAVFTFNYLSTVMADGFVSALSLESCLRNFSCLTQGDIFSVSYNMISFEFLVMEVHPGDRRGISCQDTDLEVRLTLPGACLRASETGVADRWLRRGRTHAGRLCRPEGLR